METEDLDKILSKPYSELNASERETIQDICSSEEEFVQLQQFFASVENYVRETHDDSLPLPETKDKLDGLFHQTYQSKGVLWYNSMWSSLYPTEKRFDQRPLVRIAAILVVLIAVVPFLNGPETHKNVLATKNAPKENKEAVQPGKTETTRSKATDDGKVIVQGQAATETAVSPVLIAALDQDVLNKWVSEDNVYDRMSEKEGIATMESTITGYFSAAPSISAHPDGIYMDTFNFYDTGGFRMDQNLAVLDLLTPTF